MPSFESMFMQSRGKPIQYKGKTLVMTDDFPLETTTKFHVVFEHAVSEYKQGIALNCEGDFIFRTRHFNGTDGLVFWQNTSPETIELEVISAIPLVQVKNVWDVGDGVIDSWHNGSAMIVESLANGRRYRCNDGIADDDFDDIVFRIVRNDS